MDIKNDLNDNLNKIYKLSNENKELKEELNNIRCGRKKDKQIRTRYIFFRR